MARVHSVDTQKINRQVWQLAWPLILANISVPLLGIVDTAVMGHQDQPEFLGAVDIASRIFAFTYWGLFGFLRMGTVGLVAQAYGRRDGDEIRSVFGRALIIAVGFGVLVWILQTPIILGALGLFEADAFTEGLARDYFNIRIWSAPAVLILYAQIGLFLGTQNTRAPLYLQVGMNVLNIILDLVFVIGLGWGIEGVAAASALSEVFAATIGMFLLFPHLRKIPGRWLRDRITDVAEFMANLSLNAALIVRTLALLIAFAWMSLKGAEMGGLTLETNAILIQFQMMMSFGLDGFAHSAEILVGNAIGEKNRNAMRFVVKRAAVWCIGLALLMMVIYAFAGWYIIDLLTKHQSVRENAYLFLPWMLASPIISLWAFLFDGVYVGASKSFVMAVMMVISLCVFLILTEALIPVWGNHALWFSFLAFMAVRGLTLALYYPRLERQVAAA